MMSVEKCQSAYNGGDMEYFRAMGCNQSGQNAQLILEAKKAVNTKTYVIIGGGILLTGILIYLSVK